MPIGLKFLRMSELAFKAFKQNSVSASPWTRRTLRLKLEIVLFISFALHKVKNGKCSQRNQPSALNGDIGQTRPSEKVEHHRFQSMEGRQSGTLVKFRLSNRNTFNSIHFKCHCKDAPRCPQPKMHREKQVVREASGHDTCILPTRGLPPPMRYQMFCRDR